MIFDLTDLVERLRTADIFDADRAVHLCNEAADALTAAQARNDELTNDGYAMAEALDMGEMRLAEVEKERDTEFQRRVEAIGGSNELVKRLAEVEKENMHLRAALANSKDPCIYCQLPAEEMAKCRSGFPGCSRMDDISGCPEFGAMMNEHHLLEKIAEVEKERDEQTRLGNNALLAMAARAEAAEKERDEARTLHEDLAGRFLALARERNLLKQGILDYITGDYPNPRQYRPHNCPHGVFYWQECEQCNAEHFAKLLGDPL